MKQMTLLFPVKDNQVLLAMKKRGFGAGRWNGLGGKVTPGESVEQAMIRESYEEALITPTKYRKVGIINFTEPEMGKLKVDVFKCIQWDGVPTETEEMAPKWFEIDQLPFDDMWGDDPFWLPKIFAGELIRASFTLDDQGQVIAHDVKVVDSL